MAYRLDKVASLIKEELSLIFLHKLKEPQFGFVTITNVKISPDLKIAKIYISVYDKNVREELLEKVNDMKGKIRGELSSKIKLRFTPELNFYIDDTQDYVEKISRLFNEIKKNDKPNEHE